MTLENISCYKSKAVFPMCMWYHKWQKSVSQENLDPRLWLLRDPRLWFSQFCSLGFHSDTSICSTMPFPSIWKFWSCCLSFHWLSIIFTMGYLVSHCLWLFLCWLGQFLWSFERCSWEDIFNLCFCCCKWILWVGSGWNWCNPHWKYQVKPD